ncbi:hypothetical protein OJ997_28685 [Solirubrobacter phytolaccae]|uniref:Uncharacterized protein n=1 Tax=Solirubrobacter phytolaccae TaxID=1404360 RepID=A0A9X3NI69_9ACTN|nr:hypothetical protein [Solirubrobacter phytolaccae]MDA0184316.1 hypothetical protein [Solirubrobacter phytolaccae]
MSPQTGRTLTLLNDSSEAHMAIWRLRAALPECPVMVKGRDVQIPTAERGEIDRALKRIPDARDYLSW